MRPLRDEALDVSLWNAADEQVLTSEVRHALEVNGLRIGLITGALPADVESILNAPAPREGRSVAGQPAPMATTRCSP